jgi:menaquinone-dependent protoporphyrinogen oxidase
MQNQVSRREFVEISAASFAAVALACGNPRASLASAAEMSKAAQSQQLTVPNGSRILVAYASRYGSTAEIAQALGRDLQSRGYKPEVLPVAKVSQLGGYRAILLGSAVRAGDWLGEATGFVRQHQREIRDLPNAFFTVHMMNTGDDEKSRSGRLRYLNRVREMVRPDSEVFFAGRMDLNRLSFGERLLCRVVGGASSKDLRNWPAIHAWGSKVFLAGGRS